MVRSRNGWLLLSLVLLMLLTPLGCVGGEGIGEESASSSQPTAASGSVSLPGVGGGSSTVVPTPRPTPTSGVEISEEITPLPPPVPKPGYGVQLHLAPGRELDKILRWARGLGVGWVKQQVEWHTIEHGPDDFDWHTLDRVVEGADGFGFKVLLSVTHAPDWTRSAELESGPPTDYAQFGRFMEQLARRYRGRVEAYELWNEPNLAREWRGDTLDPARFVSLVAEGAHGVRAGDPDALIISGAPAVTGIDDGETAISDRAFLRGTYEAGIGQHVDAIGAHPYGYGNPPEESV
ncbi:MAG: cellulase family glycosylhydrolase, partial [Anaerolineae bacterium]